MNGTYYINQINPIIFSFGPFYIYWYGLMYIFSFIFTRWKMKRDIALNQQILKQKDLDLLLSYTFLGIIIGGRLGYILFYNFYYFINNKSSILKIWEGGMSFHGGLIGGILSILFFSKKLKKNFFKISDFIIPYIPFGLGAGRVGNFINGELWGRVSQNSSFAMLFPKSIKSDLHMTIIHPQWKPLFKKYGMLPRHPSQLYEFICEGILLFYILNFLCRKIKTNGILTSMFLINYGIIRICMEEFREPDPQIGFIMNYFTLGQILSIPMIITGITLLIKIFCKKYHKSKLK